MKKEFPVYFVDKKRDVYYRIDGVKEIDTKTGKAFYKGATVYNDTLVGWYASDTVTFYIASWKDMEEITEEEFNTKYNNVKNDMEDNQWNFTSTNEFKEKRFAKIEPRHYEMTIQTIDSQIDDLILDKAQTLVEGYANLVKQYGVRTVTGMELDTSKTFFLVPVETNLYLQKIVRTCGIIYFIYGSNTTPSTKKRLEHFPDDIAIAQLLDDLFYYFENL